MAARRDADGPPAVDESMEPACFEDDPLLFYSYMLSSASAVLLSALFLYLTMYCTSKTVLKNYERMLFVMAAVNLTMAIIKTIIPMEVNAYASMLVFHMETLHEANVILSLPLSAQYVVVGIYFVFHYYTIYVCLLPFIYRYILLVRNVILQRRYMMLLIVCTFMLAVLATAPRFHASYLFREDLMPKLSGKDESKCHCAGCFPIVNFKSAAREGDVLLNVYLALIRGLQFLPGACYAVIGWLSWKMWIFVRARGMSKKTAEANRQILWTMAVQLVSPAIVAFLPTCLFVLLKDWPPWAVYINQFVFHWNITLNCLPMIVVVRPYRSFIMRAFKRMVGLKVEASSTKMFMTTDGVTKPV